MVRRRLTVEELEQKNKFLEEQLSFYKVIADNSYDWEMLLSPQGKYVYVSPSCRKITGYTSEEFIQNSDLFNDIVFKDDILKVKHHVERKLQREEIENHLEFRIITKEGSLKWISHLCQEAFDEDNNFIGYRSSNRDITRQKEEE